eukprot:4275-Heterococcus_DN1.PRE.1
MPMYNALYVQDLERRRDESSRLRPSLVQLGGEECHRLRHLSAEAVQGAALALEGVDNVHCSHSLTASVLSVGDRVADDVLKEDLEDTTGLLVDEATDTLDTSTPCQTPDGWLSDALDVVAQHLAVTLGATLA